ncbi:MAG TPA: hypothetical protein VNG69_12950 [Casimicrobiaceae bacterium]|nr:hypothetical protein [Casimicrobiaceae bacterium]
MEWIVIEAVIALGLGLAIVWWTMSPSRKREREEECREAAEQSADNAGNGRRTADDAEED